MACAAIGALLALAACSDRATPDDGRISKPEASLAGCDTGPNNFRNVGLGTAAASSIAGEQVNLFSIWGASKDAIFAVGSEGKVLFFDGKQWVAQTTPTKDELTAVWGTSATDVWAVGWNGVVIHYDGKTWVDRSPPIDVFLTQVAEAGLPKGDAALASRRNLWGVWAAGTKATDALYVVGDRGLVLYLAKNVWAAIPSGVEENLASVWGTSATSVFIVGDFGTILTGGPSGLTKANTGTAKPLHRVWGRNGGDIYAVGLSGTILHFNGSAWTAIDGAPKQYLRGVWGSDKEPGATYIVGWDGTLLKMTGGPGFGSGAKFELFRCVTTRRLEGLWGTNVPGQLPDAGAREGGPPDGGVPLVPAVWISGVSGTIITGP